MKTLKTLLLMYTVLVMSNSMTHACTATKLKAKDGSVVYARTLEFSINIHSNIIMIPRNYSMKGTSPFEGKGLVWKTKYAVVGANAEGQKLLVDGVNEKGLAVGTFYFPGYANYQQVDRSQANESINSVELGVWLLTNFATLDEVKQGLKKIKVSNAIFKPWGFTAPVHYLVTSPTGNSLVIEYVNGKLHLYDNPLGAFTNSPDFNWMKTNLRNYVNLSPLNVSEIKVNNKTVRQLGQGSGMHGLPGDFTPPSRFVRSAAFTASSIPLENAQRAIDQAFHLLNNFDLPKGAIRENQKGKELIEYTLWTSAIDLSNKRFYFHTYENRDLKMVALNAFDLDAKFISVIPMGGTTTVHDVSKTAKKLN